MLIYLTISALGLFICVGFVLLPVAYVAGIVLPIIASVKASNGESFRYPLTIRMIS